MAVNKVVVNDATILDLTSDTVVARALLKGYTAHDKSGVKVTGTVETVTYYTGTSKPASTVGSNGDLYLQIGG